MSVRAPSIAAAIWSQKDMRSPSGGKARRRGGTQVGKAPPSPEMTISGLTESGLSGRISPPRLISPGSAGRCGPSLRRAVSFLGSCLQRLSANHFAPSGIPHRGSSGVKRAVEPAPSRPHSPSRPSSSRPSGGSWTAIASLAERSPPPRSCSICREFASGFLSLSPYPLYLASCSLYLRPPCIPILA